ncbi:MAG: aldo/keto reductase [Candidatus Omnitrophica bacterium]|nr:aldo/keto reductase [Candidatus Omnitrophota bacterium]
MKRLGNTDQMVPVIGQGTGIGGALARSAQYGEKQRDALRLGIELGMTFIDTAEEYGGGAAEEMIGEVIRGIRKRVCVATKFSPEHSDYKGVLNAAEGSLRRLQTDYIDVYQIHWPHPTIPISETVRAMEQLVKDGKVRYLGVGNVSLKACTEIKKLLSVSSIVSIELEYNLFDRSIEDDILPFCEQNGITLIAYSPLNRGAIADSQEKLELLENIAVKYKKTGAQVALNWLVSHNAVVAIPKAESLIHIKENAAATDFKLSEEDYKKINAVFTTQCVYGAPKRIRVVENKQLQTYYSLTEARENKLGFCPSPADLAEKIKGEERIRPLRVIKTTDRSGQYDYDLIEGRIRYWALVIAYGWEKDVPIYVCSE